MKNSAKQSGRESSKTKARAGGAPYGNTNAERTGTFNRENLELRATCKKLLCEWATVVERIGA